ncbi:MAG: UDP-N-acetylmuramoyl-tripeptide-D-alanyl-D-alanine ligase [Candidatus Giovannonibacteria bacterium GW2011_GWC2_44_9]|uniref:UDP-N-acetylmuramoyl-tripeptide-D-alanyl-D-alanine ligase n=3 Tax=Candidatus Giovannoniibacteriota TaxID=1752738 RepID=A0A0G1LVZ6_9BACT|nr:MAG: UDP-N-acetylmuramoyl-tripeptide-D-alanyl-D-alanine ligase [Candidatus Giovannonibacteria bacterium GW2011_GWB1_44_23]KKT63909.1 MAG: UDP-N-acetylmuramoyl-tripeptide-D-alanyl-D-alanine ligase [Candidatus Giovannonibacteria bacterium GW2011_GWA1_44_29]KKT83625.1 MAG: UDP-N-acetylmuramoyl-tripeptide-D-alanyl-D-alanine ligase [Candidatus Giovannonibacteria bacterium GW2011_GWC2_44_9]KKT91622.1 MAG: UDP-N-acetylmuramoylalanyl-D-glutamyl-2,6-diaminopimelate-D-alanyl-D-alanyl ligase, UDP-N-acet
MIKTIVTKILALEAKIALRRYQPRIIGITGSVGKSSAKEAVAAVLESRFNIRESIKSYNSELGMALAVLGLKTAWNSPIGWIKNIIYGFEEIFNKNFPKILVLEMGVDRPRDFDKLLKIVRPDIGIVTAVGEIPVHVEFFSGPEEVTREKSKLVKNLSSDNWAILNFDDETVWSMSALGEKLKTNASVIGFGFGNGADILASNYKISKEGISFKMDYKGSSVPVRLKNVFGKHFVYAALSATAVGIIFEMNLIEISEALSRYHAPPGRLRLLPGIKNSLILDDSYNASPLATEAALDTLKELDAERKIVAFGDMLEIGKFTILAHQAAGKKIAKIADYFVAVGPRSRFAAEEAIAQEMNKSKVINFSTSQEAASHLKSIIREGDLILVKGSQSMRMELITEELMAHPEEAQNILARQDEYWKNKK